MLFFEAAKRLFTEIVANANMQLIYGTFAAVPLFLTWLYLVWVLILSGAIVVRTLGLERDDVRERRCADAGAVRSAAGVSACGAHLQGHGRSRAAISTTAVKLSRTERDVGVVGSDGTQVVVERRRTTSCCLGAICAASALLRPRIADCRTDSISSGSPSDTRSAAVDRAAARICALWCGTSCGRPRFDRVARPAEEPHAMKLLALGAAARRCRQLPPVDFEYADGAAGRYCGLARSLGGRSTTGPSGARRAGMKFRNSTHSTSALGGHEALVVGVNYDGDRRRRR